MSQRKLHVKSERKSRVGDRDIDDTDDRRTDEFPFHDSADTVN